MNFSKLLEDYLQPHSLTQSDFAKQIGVKPSQVNEWLKGKASPGYAIMKRILENTDEPAEYWFDIK